MNPEDNKQIPPEVLQQCLPPPFPGEYRLALKSLFLRPNLSFAIVTARSWWGRGLLMVLLVATLAGTVKMLTTFPDLALTMGRVATYIGEQVGDISFQDGKMVWAKMPEEQLTGHLLDVRVDILPTLKDFPRTDLSKSLEKHGVLVSPELVEYWRRDPALEDDLAVVPVLNDKMLARFEDMVARGYLPNPLTPEQLVRQVNATTLMCAPVLIVFYALERLKTVMFCVLLFTFFQCLFHRGGWRQFGPIMALGLHCCLLPLAVASLYDCLQLSWGSFETVFWIMLVAYMFLIYLDRRSALSEAVR